MKNKILKICLILLIFLIFIGETNLVNADMGPKPSITVKITNMDTADYLIDLLVYDESGENYFLEPDYNGSGLTKWQIDLLHNVNYEGWISESTRWHPYLLFPDCAGNTNFEHYFSYFGTPEIYRVLIINNKTGEMKISDIIHRTEFTSSITIDVNSMQWINKTNISLILRKVSKPLVITVIIELLIAIVMKIKHLKIITLVNLLTNIIAQIILMITPIPYLITFLILEILIIISECLIYKRFIKDVTTKKIITYTLWANIITALLTFSCQFISAANLSLIFEEDLEGIIDNIKNWWIRITH